MIKSEVKDENIKVEQLNEDIGSRVIKRIS